MKSTLLFLVTIVCLTDVISREFDIQNLKNSDGISNSSITKIYQDSTGLIWFGTWDGLNVYNGRDFKVYKPESGNPYSISNNIIRDIVEENSNTLWISTDKGINRYDKKERKFKRFFTESHRNVFFNENSFFIAKNNFNCIYAYITEEGLYYFNNQQQNFVKLNLPVNLSAKKMFFDLDENLWILTLDKQLFKIDFRKGNYSVPKVNSLTLFKHLNDIESVFLHKDNSLYIQSSNNKVYMYSIPEGTITMQPNGFAPKERIKDLLTAGDQLLWGGANALYMFNPQTQESEKLLDKLSVLSLLSGSQSIIWVGTDTRGVFQLTPTREKFKLFSSDNIAFFGRDAVRAFYQDEKGILWVGTKGSGVYGLSNNADDLSVIIHFSTQNGLLNNSVYCLTPGVNGEMWIGTDGTGLNYYNPKTNKLNQLNIGTIEKNGHKLTSVYSILTMDNTIWIGTSGNGMFKLEIDRNTNPYSVKSYKQYIFNKKERSTLSNNIVYSIIKAGNNSLWIGTRGGGINHFNIKTESFKTYLISNNEEDLISANDIISLYKDAKEHLWIGTSMGLYKLLRLDNDVPVFQQFTEKEGMPNNTIHGILEDSQSNIWVSTNNGLVKLIQTDNDQRIVTYYQSDGLQSNEFSDGAFYANPHNEKFYFGGINGFNAFNPLMITSNTYMPSLYMDAFYVDNIENDLINFQKDSKNGPTLHITHEIKSFSFKFIPIDYIASEKCEISYLLEGFQKDWIHLGTSNNIVFSNLPKGNYMLKVRCSNAEKVWSDQPVSYPIIVHPPWWANNVAFLSYFLLLIMSIFGLNRLTQNQLKTRNEIKIKELERQKTEEIHQAKLRFFTNIAHEFSNSLTLIYGPCIQLLRHNSESYTRKHINTIKSNAERMQNLIQQLIDFRKAETGYLKPNYKQVEITELIKYVADYFNEILAQKQIKLKTCFNPETIFWNTDWDCIEKIVFNLLSNAVKYTPPYKEIMINAEVNDDSLKITVSNYGIGIKGQNMQSVFNRFEVLDRLEFQASKGLETRNGIGLALCKNITEILNGKIHIESDEETFTSFVVTLPQIATTQSSAAALHKPILSPIQLTVETELKRKNNNNNFLIPDEKKQGLILIIDDEKEIRELLVEFLIERFEIIEAENGKEAIELMRLRLPVLIICDVIMPEMNGVEFVTIMKSQELTKYIPIILLSSKSGVENQIEGLEIGADGYIGKPFHPRYIEATIDRLLQRNRDMLEFSGSAYASVEQFNGKLVKKEDKNLLIKITKLILDHIDDESLSLDSIASEMAISKMQLYRRIKEITNQTPTEFIRNIRLNHAEILLKTTNKTVQEIMYECGFINKTYFYREFAKKYQKTPKEYRNQR